MNKLSVMVLFVVAAVVLTGATANAAVYSPRTIKVQPQIKTAPPKMMIYPAQQQRLITGPTRQTATVVGVQRMDTQNLRVRAKLAPPIASIMSLMRPEAKARVAQESFVLLDNSGNVVQLSNFKANITDIFYRRDAAGRWIVAGLGGYGAGGVDPRGLRIPGNIETWRHIFVHPGAMVGSGGTVVKVTDNRPGPGQGDSYYGFVGADGTLDGWYNNRGEKTDLGTNPHTDRDFHPWVSYEGAAAESIENQLRGGAKGGETGQSGDGGTTGGTGGGSGSDNTTDLEDITVTLGDEDEDDEDEDSDCPGCDDDDSGDDDEGSNPNPFDDGGCGFACAGLVTLRMSERGNWELQFERLAAVLDYADAVLRGSARMSGWGDGKGPGGPVMRGGADKMNVFDGDSKGPGAPRMRSATGGFTGAGDVSRGDDIGPRSPGAPVARDSLNVWACQSAKDALGKNTAPLGGSVCNEGEVAVQIR